MKKYRLLPLFLLLFSAFTILPAQTVTEFIDYDGISRSYRLHLPTGYVDGMKLPLVFNLHGLGSNASEQEFYSQMNTVADTAMFIVCYANGVNSQWNVGWSFNQDTDDVGFINALIDTLKANYNINLNRVYSCGMSNGGFMSYTLACELTDRIAAIASVTGSMAPGVPEQCNPTRQIPVMQVHGTADPTVPFNGTATTNIPIEELVSFWRDINTCGAPADTTEVPNISVNDNCTAERLDYTDCGEGIDMVFYKIFGGEHTWPGAPINIGVTNQDFNASVEIWRFFSRYELDVESAIGDPVQSTTPVVVAPNPFQESLNLILPAGGLQALNVFDFSGKQLFATKNINTRSYHIDSRNWPAGVYLVSWQSTESQGSMKVVK